MNEENLTPILFLGVAGFLYFILQDFGVPAIALLIGCMWYAEHKKEGLLQGIYYFICSIFAFAMIIFFGSMFLSIF